MASWFRSARVAMPTTEKVEVIYFPKKCCGQPIVVIKKFSGSSWMQCRVTGELASQCNNSQKK